MCGIVGAVTKRSVTKVLINGLKKLEYRGYDSAGMAVIDESQTLKRLRVAGKVRELEMVLQANPLHAHMGIAHTRWATHGVPSEQNAHPFISHDKFALVHNGIIENHHFLREKLLREGYQFLSETDTETAVHLIHYYFTKTKDFLAAVMMAANELKGAYALGIVSADFPNHVMGVRQGAPLVVGKGQGENFLASDPLALLSVTKQFIYLEDDDVVDITLDAVNVYNKKNQRVEREEHTLSIHLDAAERGEYRHYMKKEIMEQPNAVASCLSGRMTKDYILPAIFGPQAEAFFSQTEHVQFVACGTSHHAALVARYWLESLANIPCSVEVASEFRYRDIAQPKKCLYVTLSQSGETADTLAALRLAKKMEYVSTLAICNVPSSTMMRETALHFLTHAGVEIGVASTKAFVTQLVALFLFTLALRHVKNKTDKKSDADLILQLQQLPRLIKTVLQQDEKIAEWAKSFTDKQHAIFIGRGCLYPVALEGALKMKEISYIHAEAYPAGELKHGPLALVDSNMPVITTVFRDALLQKNLSSLQEVQARGGNVYVFTDQADLFHQDKFFKGHVIDMPTVHPLLAPILYTIPLQLLAYHVAVLKGTDVDQPRNLAKSVTVE